MNVHLLLVHLVITTALSSVQGLDQAVDLYLHGHFHKAADLLSSLCASSPDNAEMRLWSGKALLKIRKWDDAVHQMERAVELEPNNAVYYLWLGRACGGRASHSAFFTASGWARKVLKAFETAQNLAPDNLEVRFDLMTYYLEAPAFLGGGRDKAEAEAAAIAKLSPSAGYTARALIFEKDKKWDQAEAELLQATALFPQDKASFVELAGLLLDRGNFRGAEANACQALSLCPNLPRARLVRAAAEIRLGENLAKAETVLRSLSQGPLADDDPAFQEVFYWLGQAYLAQGKKPEAQGAFSTALRYNPDYDKAKNALFKSR